MTGQGEVAEWLSNRYDESIIRIWNDGGIEFAMNSSHMDGKHVLRTSDLPGNWHIEDVTFSTGGVVFDIGERDSERRTNARVLDLDD